MRLYVDLRCLQDPAFSFRGVGLHTASILRHARTYLSDDVEIVGILDETLPSLPEAWSRLVDHLQHARSPQPLRETNLFLQPSPMTHDPSALGPLVSHHQILSFAIVYDFIPLDEPRYLPTPQARRRYLASLYWLKLHQLFYPISRYSANRLRQVIDAPANRIAVTGASVRPAFASFDPTRVERIAHRSRFAPGRYFLLVGGSDERKNQALALEAHARLPRSIGLVIAGHHEDSFRRALEAKYRQQGGRMEQVEFVAGLSDDELAALYHRAVATICPSRIEGFSLPVVEAVACGCPVLVSNNDAHRELVHQPDALFSPDDADTLTGQLIRLLDEPEARLSLLNRQAPVAPRFAEAEVARRLWTHVVRHLDAQRVPSLRSADCSKPRLAVLSPYAPDRSGVADYTARSLESISQHARVDVFTETTSPRPDPWVHRFYPLSDLAYLQGEYDRVVAVIGNSSFHWRILQLHKRYGGACLMHDNRLAELYAWKEGLAGLCQRASAVLGRSVSLKEAADWLEHPGRLPALFFDELLLRADPLMVHSRGIQAQVARRYHVEAEYLPFCCYRHFADRELSDEERRSARERLGIPPERILIISLGIVAKVKGAHECLYALDQLRAWGMPAEVHFVGEAGELGVELKLLADRLQVREAVRFMDDWISDQTYRDYLLAADFAIQLRSHGFGGLSGAVMDCIVAGLPTVANDDLATAMDAPKYVLRVPDTFSPLLIAEQFLLAWQAGRHQIRCGPARDEYIREHSFARYASRMMQVLRVAA
jgi:glycosyltransferase involved in cell wall biosynthesis